MWRTGTISEKAGGRVSRNDIFRQAGCIANLQQCHWWPRARPRQNLTCSQPWGEDEATRDERGEHYTKAALLDASIAVSGVCGIQLIAVCEILGYQIAVGEVCD